MRRRCAAFPAVEFRRGPDATLNLIEVTWPIAPLPAGLQEALAPEESIALHMMDRLDPGEGFGRVERQRHYQDLLRTWAGALEHFRPDCVVFSIAPHLVFDYVLYALCRHFGIRTVMFERHGLPGWVFPVHAIDQPSRDLVRAAARRSASAQPPVPAPYEEWLGGLVAGSDLAVPPNFRRKLELYRIDPDGGAGSPYRGLAYETKRALLLLLRHGLKGPRHSYLRSSRAPHGRASWLETARARFRGLLKKRRLARELGDLASDPIPGEAYVLLALHYEPERSTVPMGGPFGDQLLVVDLLARVLPEGWRLYVKEHPWQLQPFGRGEMGREADYYRRIAQHANVRIIAPGLQTADLIGSARAVATVCGSAGWQAVCRGVPAIVFGEAWYALCQGVHRVRDESDARAAMVAIASGARVPAQSVRRFVAALAEVCVPGVLEPALEDAGALDHEAAAVAMADALVRYAGDG